MLYFLDENPKLAGDYLADKHLSCMLNNACTVICTILKDNNFKVNQKTYSRKNKIVDWASTTSGNFEWLCKYAQSISKNFKRRYGKEHKTSINLYNLPEIPKLLETKTDFPQLIPDKYKVVGDTVGAYRDYYSCEKAKLSDYKNKAPKWLPIELDSKNNILYSNYFDDLKYSLRLYKDIEEGLILQYNVKGVWVTFDTLKIENKILFERAILNKDAK